VAARAHSNAREGEAMPTSNVRPIEPQDQGLVDTTRAARYLNFSTSSLNKWRLTGDGPPFYKIGRGVRYRIPELEEWAARRRRNSTSDNGA
jgi:hypothetical protein